MTGLKEPLQRMPLVGGSPYTPIVDSNGLERVGKKRRKRMPPAWAKPVNGKAGLAAALRPSMAESPR